ncbi:phenylalanine--tRNA ligase [Moraxella bovoculi]|uniref:phenylalanine--tRNA ligase subunit beta n=1 Tax=Moraxella bovoculi TaxID=386891 RepID=UPI000624CBA8|nr:phenylalanine--tRNA ligase subunit beta [Moraxella bovoculi]AKG18153.1 phenylalanine--tRNA ligase [Moraxella bovoculi]NSM11163.1 phenylalanine--tRNA ligase subunit beta [Moraxella bovoculi]
MKISENWLRQWANPANTSDELGQQLTMAGLELDGSDTVAPEFSGVVVGEVITCEQHPDADRLRVTTVNIGTGENLQIVCGAPNVRTGLKVAVATVGAVLPPIDGKPFNIKKGKLRGIESQGMLCGASEIGLTDEIDGILELPDDAPIGVDVRDYLGLDAMIFDIAITPNRGDCFSALGLAREISVINRLPLSRSEIKVITPNTNKKVNVNVLNDEACPRYLAQYISNIDRTAKSPKWLVDNLMASGMRTHNFLVDVTNYVLLELGQPLHAFDADKIQGDIVVRLANQGETLELLNEQTITLTGDELLIADDVGALALAGIMGGMRSSVTDETTNIVLESAHFNQLAIAARARRFGLHTDASQRFERGVDFELPLMALHRATALIHEVAGAEVGQITTVENLDKLPKRSPIHLPYAKIEQLLGVALPSDEVVDILNRLEIVTQFDGDKFICQPPSHRFDINIAEDLVEEIARIHGYDHIKPRLPEFAVDMSYDDTADLTHELKLSLAASGYFEAVSFSFSDAKIEALFNDDKLGAVLPLANPISADLAVMRRTLLSSLLPVVSYNLNRQQPRVRLFETGLSFVGQNVDNLVQTPSLAMVATGLVAEEGIYDKRVMDFFDLKRDVESLLPQHLNKTSLSYERADLAFLHPGQSAYLVVNGVHLGWFGQLHPSIAKALDLPAVWVAQFAIEDLIDLHRATNAITAPSKFPSVRRDLAFLVDKSVEWQDLVVDIRAAAGKYLTDLWLFDVYEGDRLPEGRKSLAFAMLFQNADATLEDDVIKKAMDDVASRLSDKHGAKLRDS